MAARDSAMETALLEIAKDLLQASDDLASTDPTASAKLAQEAYEIGRDLGIVRNHVDELFAEPGVVETVAQDGEAAVVDRSEVMSPNSAATIPSTRRRDVDDESDADLLRILDRQKAMLPKPVELAPARKPSRGTRSMSFESVPRRRSGWLAWMRPREWRHAG